MRTRLEVCLGLGLLAATAAPAIADADSLGRQVVDLKSGWKFALGDLDATAATDGYDDRAWASVDLPHTWNRLGEYALERSASTNNTQGVGWYRLKVQAPPNTPGRRLYLDFGAVGAIAEVWVNGQRVGEHRGAFSRFRFDVTDQWKPGAQNLVAVRADNSKPHLGSSTAEVLPLHGDFFIFGGLYRGVSLISADPASIDLLDHGGPGVYARATDITADNAKVEVLTRLRNAGARTRKLTAVTSVRAADGREVARASTLVSLASGQAQAITQSVDVPKPRLWNGRKDPYLYSVTVTLLDGGKTIDAVTQPLGLRTFKFDANQGFFLNGEHLPLHGVSRHQDWQGSGYALSRQQHAEDMRLIAEIGANTVRGAHYQHDDAWYEEADKAGMVMWAEVPFVSASSFDGTDGTPATFANAEQQTIELIRQQYNHPAIVMWSTGNEVDASALFLRIDKPPRALKLLQTVTARARAEDPSRATVFADCCEDTPFATKGAQSLPGTTDLIGYNRYYGWYYGKPSDAGPELDKLHAKHPDIPMSVSEYGAGGALSQHTDDVTGAPVNSFGRPHPEEIQSWYHEESWKQFKTRPYLFATWVWNMFDFASDMRQEGEAIDLNDKGLVTYDRKTKKDAFYFYQANWSETPVLHINGKRYVERPYPVVSVRAYSNAEKASLKVNGADFGEAACPDRICVWPKVVLRGGDNTVTVSAIAKGQPVTDTATWNAPDPYKGLAIDAGALVGRAAASGRRFGSDTFFEGGSARVLNFAMPGRPLTNPKVVTGAGDLWVHDSYREGDFRYRLPLPEGAWVLTIHTFEPSAGQADSRTFAVKVGDQTVLDAFSPAKSAGGPLKAVSRSIPVTVKGGVLDIAFVGQGGPAVVSAIAVDPAGPETPRPGR